MSRLDQQLTNGSAIFKVNSALLKTHISTEDPLKLMTKFNFEKLKAIEAVEHA